MIRSKRAIESKVDLIRAAVHRRRRVDGDLGSRDFGGDRVSESLDLIIAIIGAGIDRQTPTAIFGVPIDRPVDRASHVGDVDQGPPRRAIRKDTDLPSTERASDEIVKYQVKPQASRHATGGCKTE